MHGSRRRDQPGSVYRIVQALIRGYLHEDQQGAVLSVPDLNGQTHPGKSLYEVLETPRRLCLSCEYYVLARAQ